MAPGTKAGNSALTRAALTGLAVGAAVSSLLGPGIFAGFTAVALAAGAMLTLGAMGAPGILLSTVTAALTLLFPLGAAEEGERGILWAAAITFVVLAAGYVLRGLRRNSLAMLAQSLTVVLFLGLLGSYLVLVAGLGNRLLVALVLMVAAFEAAFGLLAARRATKPAARGSQAGRRQAGKLPPEVNLPAVAGGVVACEAAALSTRFFMPSPLGVVSLLILGAVVAGAAALGHAGAAIVAEEQGWEPGRGLEPGMFAAVNALLLASGAFYYGFRLYLA